MWNAKTRIHVEGGREESIYKYRTCNEICNNGETINTDHFKLRLLEKMSEGGGGQAGGVVKFGS